MRGSSGILNSDQPYVFVNSPEEVAEISNAILKTIPPPVLGVDCEGLSKGRPLSLL